MKKHSRKATPSTQGDWKTVSSGGFPPIWKPERKGEHVVLSGPYSLRRNTKRNIKGFMLEATLQSFEGESFYSGSGKQSFTVELATGDRVSVPLSAALVGTGADEMKLAFIDGKGKKETAHLTKMMADSDKVKLVYEATIPIGGGQKVKRIAIQIPS